MLVGGVCAVKAVLTLAQFSALLPHVEALTVFFLALGLLTVASLEQSALKRLVEGVFVALFRSMFSLYDRLDLLLMVAAIAAITLAGTHPTRGKTLAIHLETACLLAVAATLPTQTDRVWQLSCLMNANIGGWLAVNTRTLVFLGQFFLAIHRKNVQHSTAKGNFLQFG